MLKRTWLLGVTLGLGLNFVSQARPADSYLLFPQPVCDVKKAIEKIRDGISADGKDDPYNPSSDGFFPWSMTQGYWFDSPRGILLYVQVESVQYGPKRRGSYLYVQFRSLCDQTILATGEGYDETSEQIWTPKELKIAMDFMPGAPRNLEAVFRLGSPTSKRRERLSIEIRNLDSGPKGSTRIDAFKARRF